MKKLLTAIFLLIALGSFAQKQYGIVKTYGYYKEFIPGMLKVDINGDPERQHDTTFLAFLETKGASPVWQRAWVNNKAYRVLTTKMQNNHKVGYLNDKDDAVRLKVATGNKLVQVNLETSDLDQAPPSAYRTKLRKNAILLEGIYQNKKVYLLITNPTHLRADEHQ